MDEIITHLGDFGPYQRRTYFLLFLPTIFSAMHKMSWAFLGNSPDHRCKLPDETEDANYDFHDREEFFIVRNGSESIDSCAYLNNSLGNLRILIGILISKF